MINVLKEKSTLRSLLDFDDHKLVSYFHDEKTGLRGFIAVHRKNPKFPSFGATRLWQYESELDALKDALRLSRGMSYKAALAGLPSGGAKGVIMYDPKFDKNRKRFLETYAESINLLKGNFVTGTDVGLFQEDLPIMKKKSKYIVGFNNISTECTAIGLYNSIKVALGNTFNSDSPRGRTFAIQGAGKIGTELIRLLYEDAKLIYVSDIDPKRLRKITSIYPRLKVVSPTAIHRTTVDVFSPCALNHSLSSKTITKLDCRIIVGGANNQLESEEIGDLLFKLGILYAPDYVVNAGGLISVVDEYQNKRLNKTRVMKRIEHINHVLDTIILESRRQKKGTNRVANEMAERIFNKYR